MTDAPDHLVWLRDIVDAARSAREFAAGMTFDAFVNDRKTCFAAIRAFEIIGEAVKRVPASIRNADAQIPWRDLAGFRDKLIHDYGRIDLEIVWKSIEDDLPLLIERVCRIIDDADAKGPP